MWKSGQTKLSQTSKIEHCQPVYIETFTVKRTPIDYEQELQC